MPSGQRPEGPYNQIEIWADNEETLKEAMSAISRALRDVDGDCGYGGPF